MLRLQLPVSSNSFKCLNVEKKDPSSVYILDFKAKEWTKKSAEPAEDNGPNMQNLKAVLDVSVLLS